MCGISGYVGINDSFARIMLVIGLGIGIDERGGDAAGYVSISKDAFRYSRKRGLWGNSRVRFMRQAAHGKLCMMHSRFATCGMKTIGEAHPFAINRDGKTVLWGAHNGIIPSAWDSAKYYGRDIDVDSQELFELIADENYQGFNDLSGYGVITWIEAARPDHVKIARLSSNSEICLVSLESGGYAWASTWKILHAALKEANLTAKNLIELNDIGQAYEVHADRVVKSNIKGLKVSNVWNNKRTVDKSTYQQELEWLYDRWSDEMYEPYDERCVNLSS